MYAPLLESERAEYLKRIDAKLPTDYLDFVAQTEGATLTNCVINGVEGIRKVDFLVANYYIIAEIEELGALALKVGDSDVELFLLPYEDNYVQSVGTSLSKALTHLLKLD